jgi:hypothetical protein
MSLDGTERQQAREIERRAKQIVTIMGDELDLGEFETMLRNARTLYVQSLQNGMASIGLPGPSLESECWCKGGA